MKAWHVHDGEPSECSLLVFAETRNGARFLGFRNGTWDFESYVGMRAIRAPKWDAYATAVRVIDENDDLPVGAPPFYSDREITHE